MALLGARACPDAVPGKLRPMATLHNAERPRGGKVSCWFVASHGGAGWWESDRDGGQLAIVQLSRQKMTMTLCRIRAIASWGKQTFGKLFNDLFLLMGMGMHGFTILFTHNLLGPIGCPCQPIDLPPMGQIRHLWPHCPLCK